MNFRYLCTVRLAQREELIYICLLPGQVVPYDIDGEGESELIVTYTLGYKNQSSPVLQLTGVNVGNGQWHNISVVRERTHVTLSVDSDGDGYSVTGMVVTYPLRL